MKVMVGGARGSGPRHEPEYARYGGDTTCYWVEGQGGESILLDAGTGLARIGSALDASSASGDVLMLFTHGHLDHLAGLPGCNWLGRPDRRLILGTGTSGEVSVREAIARLFSSPLWPCPWEDAIGPARWIQVEEGLGASPTWFGGFAIAAMPLVHPGGSTAYRIDEPSTGASIVFATDLEWSATPDPDRRQFLEFCRHPSAPSLIILDGQYAESELPDHAGWGHTAREEALGIAQQVRASACWLTHHDPSATDDQLDQVRIQLQRLSPTFDLARSGLRCVLGQSGQQ
ncbi:MAG: MBL fold metallo-hydrolase [Verrucomicrobia bacterium]|nr:MBL fold metallo-hydrolase [Verrucomicrobiota bacterium]